MLRMFGKAIRNQFTFQLCKITYNCMYMSISICIYLHLYIYRYSLSEVITLGLSTRAVDYLTKTLVPKLPGVRNPLELLARGI